MPLPASDFDFTADVIGRALTNDTIWSGGNIALLVFVA